MKEDFEINFTYMFCVGKRSLVKIYLHTGFIRRNTTARLPTRYPDPTRACRKPGRPLTAAVPHPVAPAPGLQHSLLSTRATRSRSCQCSPPQSSN
eukprot:6196541-Pleurochrysis_carterae.AAC.9